MRRMISITLLLILLPLFSVVAQEEPVATEEAVVEPVAAIEDADMFAGSLQQLIDTRNDLEILATEFGGPTRPEGWNGSLDINNPQLPLLVRLDLELLVGTVMGADTRPAGWFGAVASTTPAIVRDIRHDLELLADVVFVGLTRPGSWTLSNSLIKCNRATQTLVNMLQRGGVFTLTVDPAAPDYCTQAEVQASQFSEVNLLSNSSNESLFTPAVQVSLLGASSINSDFAVGFLDRGASLRVGVIPNGAPVQPVARSTAQFSNMMQVEGEGFSVFVDYTFTTVSDAEFRALGDAGAEPNTFCAAEWCGG